MNHPARPSPRVSASPHAPAEPPSDSVRAEPAPCPRPKLRVTQLDVARAAGVHNTTVSLALRNSPAIPAVTRTRIQALAAQLGYQPDPALRALVAYRNGLALNHRTEPIAYITNAATRWGWRDRPRERRCFAGAQQTASESGYQLEHFWLGEPHMSPRRLSSVLFNRGIRAILIASEANRTEAPIDFEWEHFAALRVGPGSEFPALHRVSSNRAGNVRLAVQRAVAAGYKRPGLVVSRQLDEHCEHALSVGFTIEQRRLALEPRVPILYLRTAPIASADQPAAAPTHTELAKFEQWFARFQPDVIVASHRHLNDLLAVAGRAVPTHVALVDPLLDAPDPLFAGVSESAEHVGRLAAEMLIGQLQQNVRGLPAYPTTTLVDGVWSPGLSLPERGPSRWRAGDSPHALGDRATTAAA